MKIVILNGGFSSEREISLMTGEQIAKELDQKHEIVRIDVKDRSSWTDQVNIAGPDLVFIAMHGKYGEDGEVQSELDKLSVPYTGSSAEVSSVAFNKQQTNQIISKLNIKTPANMVIKNMAVDSIEKKIGLPCVVKPNQSGSSIAVTIVHQTIDLNKAVAAALNEDSSVLIEQYIRGREFTCGVFGNTGRSPLEVLPVVEIIPGADASFFDYHAKYNSDLTEEICPAKIDDLLRESIQELSRQVHETLKCDGLTRSDFIKDKKGVIYFLEINTIPGLSEASLCPKEVMAAGMTFRDFLEKQIEGAVR
jgi:D-alanine-D-alanine ligase